ncbi:MAG: alpha/beta fold hydrolase [Candidatus Binataceae bacterium]
MIEPIAASTLLTLFPDAAAEVAKIEKRATHRITGSVGGRIVWRIFGEGPPLIFIHGDFGSWTHWIRNLLPLAERYRVFAVDMPGYGDSDSPSGSWSPESLAASLTESIAALLSPSRRYNLGGFSFGGIIAAHVAALEGERIEHLALFGPGGSGPSLLKMAPLRRLIANMEMHEVIAVYRENLGKLMIADPAKIDDLAVFLQIENVRRARLRAGTIPQSDALLRALPRIRARLHAFFGERDAMMDGLQDKREKLARYFQPDLEFRIIPRAGHWTPYEAADRVNAILLEMLPASRK